MRRSLLNLEKGDPAGRHAAASPTRILLVEDSISDALLVERTLGHSPSWLDLTHVTRLSDARRFVGETDLVLLDLALPDASDAETLAAIDGLFGKVPVVVLTGKEDTATVLGALRAGAQDYLVKGQFDSAFLVRTISHAIERFVMARELPHAELVAAADQALVRSKALRKDRLASSHPKPSGERPSVSALHLRAGEGATTSDASWLVGVDDAIARGRSVDVGIDFSSLCRKLARGDRDISDAELHGHPRSLCRTLWDTVRQGNVWRGELVSQRDDGTPYDAELTVSPVVEAGRVTHLLVTHRDVTEDTRRREAARELERVRSNVIGIVSHDLKSPLANILGFVDVLMRAGDPLTERQRKILARVKDNGFFMVDLISDILDSARLEEGQIELVAEVHDLRRVVLDALDRCALLAENKGIQLLPDLPEVPLPVMIDRGKILQVLNNLISNALKFSPEGTTVVVTARPGPEVSVIDQGPGIAEEEVGRLFKKFSRTSVRATKGEKSTGLGLFIVNELVKLHGGTIRVDSAPGAGSTFTFTLPSGASA